jgi:hypothetical protein
VISADTISVGFNAPRTLIALLLLGQALDALTFVLFFQLYPGLTVMAERNPITAALMLGGGTAAVAFAKVGAASLVVYRSRRPLHFGRRTMLFLTAVLAITTLSGFIGAAFNSYAIYQMASL